MLLRLEGAFFTPTLGLGSGRHPTDSIRGIVPLRGGGMGYVKGYRDIRVHDCVKCYIKGYRYMRVNI